jgi:CHAT domain-containing protein/tetratricopeptide (TPR) repeat protein
VLFGATVISGAAAQAPASPDVLRQHLAQHDSIAAALVRDYPDTARTLVTRLYAEIADHPGTSASTGLDVLHGLAATWAQVWSDSFFVRQANRFERWTPVERRTKVAVDSLRLAGAALLARSGADAAAALWRRSLLVAQSIHDSAGEAAALGNIGIAFWRNGDLDSASWYTARSRAVASAIGDRRTTANALVTAASIARNAGNLASARALYQSALAAHQRIGDDRGVAADENDLGVLARAGGDIAEARRQFTAALQRNQAAGRRSKAADNLVNLANLAVATGNDADAASGYLAALAIRNQLGERAGAAPILVDIGLLAMRRSDFDSAGAAFTAAVAILDSTGPVADAVDARINLANAEGAAGALQSAVGVLSDADSIARRAGARAMIARVALARGDLAVNFNAYAEAERDYQAAVKEFRTAHDTVATADAEEGFAELLLRRGQHRNALDTLLAVRRARVAAGDTRAIASTDLLLGYAAAGAGDAAASSHYLDAADRTFRVLGDVAGSASVASTRGDLALTNGHFADAEQWFSHGLKELGAKRAPDLAYALHDGESQALAAQGKLAAAAGASRQAITAIEGEAAGLSAADRRTGFRADKWDTYLRLALLEHKRGDDAAAFDVSERLRGREMLERLGGSSETLSRRTDRAMASATAVAARLAPDQALIEYLVSDSTTLAFVIRRDGMRTIDLRIGRRAVAATVAFAREMINHPGDHSTNAPWVAPLRRLDRLLIEPIESRHGLDGVTHLLIVPFAELHYLPFAALVTSDSAAKYLVERYDLGYLPSASVWLNVLDRKGAPDPKGLEVLALAPRPGALPGSIDEVRAIRSIVGASTTVLTGDAATSAAFRADAPHFSVIHLATFGVLNQHNPLNSYVELASANGGSQRLAVHDLADVTLHARLVVLSACETALASGGETNVPAGDDWTGMVRAMLVAGADNVLATLWPVQDRSTPALMAGFYRELVAGRPLPLAVALAQRAAIHDRRRADPANWAGFVLVGAGR